MVSKLRPGRKLAPSPADRAVPPSVLDEPPVDAAALETIADNARDLLSRARAAALEPGHVKILRRFSLAEAAELLNVSARTIQRGAQSGQLPTGERNRRNQLMFSLADIQGMRERLGRRSVRPAGTRPAVVAIANFKGGVGKTSTAIHLGQYLALRGYRILMVDLDAQASLTSLFGLIPDSEVDNQQTALPYFEGSSPSLRPAIRETYWPGMHLLPANLGLYGAEFSLSVRQKGGENGFRFYRALHEGLAEFRDEYDVIIIDTPPALSFITTNALFAADGLVMPVPMAMMDYASATQFFALLADVVQIIDEYEGAPKRFAFLRLLVSKYEQNSASQQTIRDWIRAAFGSKVLDHSMGQTTVLRVGPAMETAYEATTYQKSRRTLDRAIMLLDAVNREIEDLVRAHWVRSAETAAPAPSHAAALNPAEAAA
jgi:chromosome partitioning protein